MESNDDDDDDDKNEKEVCGYAGVRLRHRQGVQESGKGAERDGDGEGERGNIDNGILA